MRLLVGRFAAPVKPPVTPCKHARGATRLRWSSDRAQRSRRRERGGGGIEAGDTYHPAPGFVAVDLAEALELGVLAGAGLGAHEALPCALVLVNEVVRLRDVIGAVDVEQAAAARDRSHRRGSELPWRGNG